MRRLAAPLLAVVLGAMAAYATACGQDDSGLLSSGRAERMLSALERTERAVETGDCDRAQSALADLDRRVDNLGGSVDRELRERLQQGVDRLERQVPEDCKANAPETTTTETTETTPTTTETVPEETVPEETVPEETVPEETVPEETVPEETTPVEPPPGDGGTPGPPEGAFTPGAEGGQ